MFLLTGRVSILTKTTAARNEGALSYLRVRGLYFEDVAGGLRCSL